MKNKFIPARIILGLVLSLFCLPVLSQDSADADKDRQYVTDQLRLSLYKEANERSDVIKLLRSGDLLLVDEIRGAYALVTAPGGERGWVKRGFLVTSPTSNILLEEEREKNASLIEEIEKLGNSKVVIDTYEKDMDKMSEEMEALRYKLEQAGDTISSLEQELAESEQALQRKMENGEPPVKVLADTFLAYWQFIVPVVLLIILLCFLISKAIVESRIKSKFHGIKIW